jgi:hypothetical protein
MTRAEFRRLSDHDQAEALIDLMDRNDWSAFFELSANNPRDAGDVRGLCRCKSARPQHRCRQGHIPRLLRRWGGIVHAAA